MSTNGQSQWVVLLNKVPKGPLSEDEVKTLLNQGILRLNDVAYRVTSEGSDERPAWKLLWQYTEFNRRKPEAAVPDVATGEFERRAKIPPEVIHRQAMTELPPDLMDISPEDLIPRSTSVQLSPEPQGFDRISAAEEPRDYKEGFSSGQRSELRWGFAIVLLIAVSYGGLKLFGSRAVLESKVGAFIAPPKPSAPPPASRSLPTAAPRVPANEDRRRVMELPARRQPEPRQTPDPALGIEEDSSDENENGGDADRGTQSEEPPTDRGETEDGNSDRDRDGDSERREEGNEPEARSTETKRPARRNPNKESGEETQDEEVNPEENHQNESDFGGSADEAY